MIASAARLVLKLVHVLHYFARHIALTAAASGGVTSAAVKSVLSVSVGALAEKLQAVSKLWHGN